MEKYLLAWLSKLVEGNLPVIPREESQQVGLGDSHGG